MTATDPLAANLRRLRQSRGLTLRALAEQVGVDNSAIARMEAGKSRPSLGVLRRLKTALGCTADALIGEESDR